MSFFDVLFGRPLANSEQRAEHIGCTPGVPIFGLDALTSAAYGPEAALALLIPLGIGGVHYIVPVSLAIIILLVIVFFSYRQTIDAYPNGGGSYTVASENLGTFPSLLAAAALMIDYVLTAAVGISAGVGALVSIDPAQLQQHTLGLCLAILLLLTLVNLRGVRDTGVAFLIPTYLFVGTLLVVICVGLFKAVLSGGHPHPVVAPPQLPAATAVVSTWLILKVFASGCAALTGVEAVSNGVTAFRNPRTKNAKKTLTIIISVLIVLLVGIALLCRVYGIGAVDPGSPHYQSVISELTAAVMGRGVFYYVTIAGILVALSLSANTAFADFPRLTRAIANNKYLPGVFIIRGRRLLYSHGIYALVGFTAILLIVFGGVTDRLIPLYAIGAFLAFTLSQAGMVVHWKRLGGKGAGWHMFVNGVGAFATGVTVIVVLIAKFAEGAWITAVMVPLLILLMLRVKKHYNRVAAQVDFKKPICLDDIDPPIVLLPIDRWSRISEKGLRFALMLSQDIRAVHVHTGDDQDIEDKDDELTPVWKEMVVKPLEDAKLPLPKLVILRSPFRFIVQPLVEYALKVEAENPHRQIAVMVPELVVSKWWQNLLHNQRAQILKLMLLVKGSQRIVVINIPWYFNQPAPPPVQDKSRATATTVPPEAKAN
ncbi:MAG TPA: APC family permease [Terracidiphilus sp.]|nr:APC family permease [Terracidiphilus sp.]